MTYTWTDNAMQGGTACDVDKVNDNLMYLKANLSSAFKEYGLVSSYVDTGIVSISEGQCYADDHKTQLVLGSDTQIDLSSPSTDTTYHIFLGLNAIGDEVLESDTDVAGANLTTITGAKKRVFSLLTDSNGSIMNFIACELSGGGLDITYIKSVIDYSAASPGSFVDLSLSIATGVKMRAKLGVTASDNTSNVYYALREKGTSTYYPMAAGCNTQTEQAASSIIIRTDESGTIQHGRMSGNKNWATLTVYTNGFIDERIS